MSMNGVNTEARRLVEAGLSVIPIRPDGTKRPALDAWKRYQRVRPDTRTLATWFRRGEGLAIIGGVVSGHVEILDFDAPELFTPWRALVEALCLGLLDRLPWVRTPTDGCHLYYRCPTIQGNLKLAQRLRPDGRPETMIETRGEGGYAIIPPSPPRCHALRRPYMLLRHDLAAIPVISSEARTLLLNAARAFNTHVGPAQVVTGHRTKSQSFMPESPEVRPGDAYNARTNWSPLLEAHGWTLVGTRGEVRYWRRPGKSEPGASATTNYGGSRLLYVFSTNAPPFEADTAYTLFATYTLLEHRGDFTAAAKALAAQGYGEPTSRYRRPPRDSWRGAHGPLQGIPLAVRYLEREPFHG
jgi:hypothetical protein